MSGQQDDPTEDVHHPKLDFSKALGSAGHETEDLGFDGVPDSGPIEENAETIAEEQQAADAQDLALESGQLGLPRLPER